MIKMVTPTKVDCSICTQEIALIQKDIEMLREDIKELNEKMDRLMIKLLDPDSGLVVKVNKNTERLDKRDKDLPNWLNDLKSFHLMKKWKNNVTKALWVLYAAIIGWIAKNIFW